MNAKEMVEQYNISLTETEKLNAPGYNNLSADIKQALFDSQAEILAYLIAEKKELIARNVPGLDELTKALDAAYNEDCRYDDQTNLMMDDEYNDGSRPPAAIDTSLRSYADQLSAQYPRAAVYIRAQGYTAASNFKKYGAGKAAMKLLAGGGSIEAAEAILSNWCEDFSD